MLVTVTSTGPRSLRSSLLDCVCSMLTVSLILTLKVILILSLRLYISTGDLTVEPP